MIIANLFKNRSTTLLVIMCLYVFFLPFRHQISSVIGFILLLFFFLDKETTIRSKFYQLTKNKIALLSLTLYLVHIVGLLYTRNFKYAGLDLEIKLPLLTLPFVLFTEKSLTKTHQRIVLKYFTFGNLAAIFWCLIASSLKYYQTKNSSEFFYNEISKFMHPSYFSMYLGFNVLAIIQVIRENLYGELEKNTKKIILLTLLCTFFLAFIVLLSSKAGILILCILLGIITVKDLLKRKFFLFSYFSLIIACALFFILSNQNATTTKRFREVKNEIATTQVKKPEEKIGSSDTRVEVWKASIQLIKTNYIIGVGTGDIKDELNKQYQKNKFVLGYSNNYNSHNQFLQFFLLFGIIGLLIFLVIIFLTVKNGLQTKNILLVQFIALITLNMLLESMLESKAGVEFYAFFLPFLIQTKHLQKG